MFLTIIHTNNYEERSGGPKNMFLTIIHTNNYEEFF